MRGLLCSLRYILSPVWLRLKLLFLICGLECESQTRKTGKIEEKSWTQYKIKISLNEKVIHLAMFVLAEMKDVIRITPEHFHQSLTDSITTLLNRKLANKVVLNVGLCIALFDITDIGHSYIYPGDGSSHTEVKFRYIIFRPVLEEILIGKIKSCSNEGVQVTLGFFDDILIPPNALQHPSRFDESDQAWVWEYPKEDGDKHDLFMDSGETIRFRVTSEIFEESLPSGPPGSDCATTKSIAPYKIVGGINEPGLGLLAWWEQPEQPDGEDDDCDANEDEADE